MQITFLFAIEIFFWVVRWEKCTSSLVPPHYQVPDTANPRYVKLLLNKIASGTSEDCLKRQVRQKILAANGFIYF